MGMVGRSGLGENVLRLRFLRAGLPLTLILRCMFCLVFLFPHFLGDIVIWGSNVVFSFHFQAAFKNLNRGLPGLVVETLPCNAGGTRSVPGQGTKVPLAVGCGPPPKFFF